MFDKVNVKLLLLVFVFLLLATASESRVFAYQKLTWQHTVLFFLYKQLGQMVKAIYKPCYAKTDRQTDRHTTIQPCEPFHSIRMYTLLHINAACFKDALDLSYACAYIFLTALATSYIICCCCQLPTAYCLLPATVALCQ